MASNLKPQELLPTASADRAAGVRLRKIEEIRVNHHPGRSTYPDKKSVLTSEATPVLNSVSGIRTLELNSRGGRLAEARHIAQVVKEHNLNTFVEFECDSACTYVLLAGRNRAATPNAKIGFHQASTAGTDADVQRAASEQMQDDYRAAHLPQSFIVRVALVPASQIWYPTQEELFAANVLTVTSLTR